MNDFELKARSKLSKILKEEHSYDLILEDNLMIAINKLSNHTEYVIENRKQRLIFTDKKPNNFTKSFREGIYML